MVPFIQIKHAAPITPSINTAYLCAGNSSKVSVDYLFLPMLLAGPEG